MISRLLALVAFCMTLTASVGAAALVADLSKHLVAITTGFAGTDVLLFGAIDGPGDVVVVVRGPNQRVTLHRKTRIAGIWVNTASMTFQEVPSFYAVASSRPLREIAGDSQLARNEIGVEHLRLELPRARASENVALEWREALIRNNQSRGLYATEVGKVVFLGSELFRSDVTFPANVPTGAYQVQVYLLRDGQVIKAQTTPLIIGKIGIEAEIFDFAHHNAALYGLVAIAIALVAGWLAHIAFRRS